MSLHNPFVEVFANKMFLVTVFAWLCAQSIKIFTSLVITKRFNFKLLLGTGGMPSAHASAVSALTISVGKTAGFDSPVCIVCLLFALITMFDAQGVRRNVGFQAATLNKIAEEIYFNRGLQPNRLKELLGHTPVEVFAGALLGAGLAFFMYR